LDARYSNSFFLGISFRNANSSSVQEDWAMTKKVYIFDIDDVLVPWAAPVHDACVAAGLTDKKTWTKWDMASDYGVKLEQWLEVVNTLVVPGGIYHAPPYPGVLESLAFLKAEGHDIHMVTARGFFDHGPQIRQWTMDWMHDYGVPGKLWFSQTKGEVATMIGATHAIDDRLKNVLDLVGAGVDTYLMTQPHNLNDDFREDRRVDSVSEFVRRTVRE
jgi:hypothetical protein